VGVCAKANKLPPPGWTNVDQEVNSVFSPTSRDLGGGTRYHSKHWKVLTGMLALGGIHGIGAPIQVYPLYENGFRAARNQTLEKNNQESAVLYADFAKVAATNPMAWNYGKPPATEEFIGTVSKQNRMICYPCKSSRVVRIQSTE
jgi:hypothetical protein